MLCFSLFLAKRGNIFSFIFARNVSPFTKRLAQKTQCFRGKTCIREVTVFLKCFRNLFLFPRSKICFRNVLSGVNFPSAYFITKRNRNCSFLVSAETWKTPVRKSLNPKECSTARNIVFLFSKTASRVTATQRKC